MRLREQYAPWMPAHHCVHLDRIYRSILKELIVENRQGRWTKAQHHRQVQSILPNVALFRTFLALGYTRAEAVELVRVRSYRAAEKGHRVLAGLFYLPKFASVFRWVMRHTLSNPAYWQSVIWKDDGGGFAVSVQQCLWQDTCVVYDCPEVCEVFCSCDHIVFGSIRGMTFLRSQTLGTGGHECDFYFQLNESVYRQKEL